ncbi:MAG: hypothetical protein GOVbin1709_49 [Prokaryotic dsDNA virus sp.]|nr:MAG: hypothetical protein GOVbin1709_49 [Prokaryotic dsDNA virus sp.]|tara:strand:+ start:3783 stop:4346 length:564 start_codon:yes stop_codon:yes gene_type:complete
MTEVEFIKEDREIEIVGVRLSDNPKAIRIKSSNGIKGYINITKETDQEPVEYYLIDFVSVNCPFGLVRSRLMFQSRNSIGIPVWKRVPPDKALNYIGTKIAGDIVTREVIPYKIKDELVHTATYVILPGENIYSIFKGHGHIIINNFEMTLEKSEDSMIDSSEYENICSMIEEININNKNKKDGNKI